MQREDIIEIRDRFLIDDSHSKIRGFVACYNEKGERLFLEENMIVKGGREAIMKAALGTANSYDAGFLTTDIKAFVSVATNATVPEMVKSNIFIDSDDYKEITPTLNQERTDLANLVVCYELLVPKASGNQGKRWGSLGLLIKNSTAGDTLFSRVTFPPYPQSANLAFYYYIYF